MERVDLCLGSSDGESGILLNDFFFFLASAVLGERRWWSREEEGTKTNLREQHLNNSKMVNYANSEDDLVQVILIEGIDNTSGERQHLR